MDEPEFLATSNSSKWVQPTRKGYLKIALVVFVLLLMFYPFESTVVPAWKLRVVDQAGKTCAAMQVNEGWAHYSLSVQATSHGEFRFTDEQGYVEFPVRKTRASLLRRIVMPVITRVLTLAHGSTGISGYVFASGMKNGPWLNYHPGQPMPEQIVVEQCYRTNYGPSVPTDSP